MEVPQEKVRVNEAQQPFAATMQCTTRLLALTELPCLLTQAEGLLVAMGQDPAIAKAAGRFTLLLAPVLVMDGERQDAWTLARQAGRQAGMLQTLCYQSK
jgi:hypothetical protein